MSAALFRLHVFDSSGQGERAAIITATNSSEDLTGAPGRRVDERRLRAAAGDLINSLSGKDTIDGETAVEHCEELQALTGSTMATPIAQSRVAGIERLQSNVLALLQWIIVGKVHSDASDPVLRERPSALVAQSRRHDRPAN